MEIIIAVLVLAGLGLVFGVVLALANKKFCVHQDPRVERIYEKLPGANCGACGRAGCMGFAEALAQGTCTVEKCAVTEDDARKEIAGILGVEVSSKIKKTAVLHCHGGNKRAKDKYIYTGIRDCVSASTIAGGPKACPYGCIGYGTCASICPFGAITMNDEDLPVVDENKCTACGKCVAVCPKHLYTLEEVSKNYAVRCSSKDTGKVVAGYCSVGCIACGKCSAACPVKAIDIIDNLARINYDICDNRGECFKVCPMNTVAQKEDKHWFNRKEKVAK